MRDKDFLMKQGLPAETRKDLVWILGSIYDEVQETGILDIQRIESLREYLDNNRELIDNKTWSIVKTETVIKRYTTYLAKTDNQKVVSPNIDIKEKNEDCYNFNSLVENYSIRKVSQDWDSKTGIYGIFIDGKIVYIGSTYSSFRQRFMGHRTSLKNPSLKIHYAIKEALEKNKEIEFRPLIISEDLEYEGRDSSISRMELKSMELALITVLKPKYNIEGKVVPFHYGKL